MNRVARGLIAAAAVLAAACSTTGAPTARKAADERAELHAQLAANYMRRNQNDVAAVELNKALSIAPRNPVANYVMALLKNRLREFPEAERHFQRALDADSAYSEARHYYAVFLCAQGRYAEAIEHFDRVVRDPLYAAAPLAYAHAGECVLSDPAHDAAQAEAYFEPALAANPRLPGALAGMARARFEAGNFLSARAFVQRYLDVGPETPRTLLLAVRVELALGADQAAADYAAQLKRRFPRSAEAAELASVMGGRAVR